MIGTHPLLNWGSMVHTGRIETCLTAKGQQRTRACYEYLAAIPKTETQHVYERLTRFKHRHVLNLN